MATEEGSDSALWNWAKLILMIIGAIVLLGVVFNIISALFPFLVVALLLYVGYRVFIKSDDEPTRVEPTQPLLLEQEETLFDDEDELEAKFRELEAKQNR
jgi:predicted membrane protein